MGSMHRAVLVPRLHNKKRTPLKAAAAHASRPISFPRRHSAQHRSRALAQSRGARTGTQRAPVPEAGTDGRGSTHTGMARSRPCHSRQCMGAARPSSSGSRRSRAGFCAARQRSVTSCKD